MNWALYVLIGLKLIGLGVAAAKHGTPNTGNHSIWAVLIANGLMIPLLLKAAGVI